MILNLTIGDWTVDCANPSRTREFYAELTGWEKIIAYNCPALKAYNGMILLFAELDIPYAPPVWPEEPNSQQKQLHFNFQVDDLATAVEEAIRVGAAKPDKQFNEAHYVTMLDPEGHPFCLCQR